MKPYVDYQRWLIKSLKDPKKAAYYLNAAIEENDVEVFLLALSHVARAHGMSSLARKVDLHRVSLHKMLSKKGNPEFRSVLKIVKASGLKFQFQPQTLRRAA
jgi:probable addiction module antidote protein